MTALEMLQQATGGIALAVLGYGVFEVMLRSRRFK